MSRFAGIKNESIRIVSNTIFTNDQFEIIEIPESLKDISSQDLITNYHFKNRIIESRSCKKLAKDMKVAFISNWAMECGLASYAKNLYSELINHIGEYKLFIEINNNPIEPINLINGELISSEDKIIQCWERGKSLNKLVEEIKKYNPDIILLQHEYGLFPNARNWISMMNQLSSYKIIVTMHSVFRHQDKTIVEAAMTNIVVHLDGAKKVLKEEKKVSANVYVINHGTTPCTNQSKLWNFYKSEYTFMQQGFLFRYKGFQNSIEAVKILKPKYPDIFFTGLCSESPFGKFEHDQYYDELMELVKLYGIEENVGLIRGYQSDEVLNSFLRINKVAVFPYISNKEHECFGASGAAPYAMNKGIPVISSNIHHFSSLPTIKAETSEDIAFELDKLFSSKKAVEEQVKKQNVYLEENNWYNTALKYIEVFEC